MSILMFLFFASVVYFLQTRVLEIQAAADPITTPKTSTDQEHVDKFMAAMESAYDENIATLSLISAMSEDDQDYIKTTTLDGVGSFINYCVFVANQQSDSESTSEEEDDDIIMLFETADTSMPAVAYQQPPVQDKKEADA